MLAVDVPKDNAVGPKVMPARSASRRPALLIVVLALWLVSAAVRFAMYDSRQNVADLDATYHVLLTVQAYRETPVSVHRFLPLVTLGHAPERGVPFGTTVPDAHGIYYYTSFTPA